MYYLGTINLKINKENYFYILYELIDNTLKFSEIFAQVRISEKKIFESI
jgi:DNA-binding HxlR family transcriptional regulator